MFVFSETIQLFLKTIRLQVQEILSKEVGVQTTRNGFVAKVGGKEFIFRIKLSVFEGREGKGPLAYFDAPYYQIAFNRVLIYQAKNPVIRNIIRHELAHLLTYIFYGSTTRSDHGPEFQNICKRFNWDDKSISGASANLQTENLKFEGDLATERVLEKIKKLLALTASANIHEAELAMIRANQLLLKHNLQNLHQLYSRRMNKENFGTEDIFNKTEREEFAYTRPVLTANRKSAKMHAIADILRTFLIYPVFCHGEGVVRLQVTGNRTNVELADYIAKYLDQELERIWSLAKKEKSQRSLGGLRARNSFMMGVADGYISKIEKGKSEYTAGETKALVLIAEDLKRMVDAVYGGRLGHSHSNMDIDIHSLERGLAAGKSLTVHSAINDGNGNKGQGEKGRLLLERI